MRHQVTISMTQYDDGTYHITGIEATSIALRWWLEC